MTNESLNAMAIALEAYIKDKDISQSEAAKKIGISPSYVTHAIKRNWDITTGSGKSRFSDQIARRIMKFLGLDLTVWETDNYMMIYNLLYDCKKYQEHRIICGSKGTGKTFAARHFQKLFPAETFLITCSEDMNPKAFMMELAKQVGADSIGDRRKIRLAVGEKLKRMKNPIVMIDEGENAKPATYGGVKALYDDVKDYAAIVLIGANNYFDTLKKRAEAGKGCFPQIFSRFSSEPALLSDMFREDVKKICELNGIKDKETIDKLFNKCSDFRELDRNIKRILRDKKL